MCNGDKLRYSEALWVGYQPPQLIRLVLSGSTPLTVERLAHSYSSERIILSEWNESKEYIF